MANISREDDLKDVEERLKYGHRLHGRSFPSTVRSEAFNKIYGTNFCNDEALDRYEQNKKKIDVFSKRDE